MHVRDLAVTAAAAAPVLPMAQHAAQHALLQLDVQHSVERFKLYYDSGNVHIFPEHFADEVGGTSPSRGWAVWSCSKGGGCLWGGGGALPHPPLGW